MTAHVLMLSSSREGNEAYLAHARPLIFTHLGELREILFIPFAGVTKDWDDYVSDVQTALGECKVTGIHTLEDPVVAIRQAKQNRQAIVVGGGNTFNLLDNLYRYNLIVPLRQAIAEGTCYIGWSAGSNIAGASIRTTNDMPIVEPPSFTALNILPVQLNPHYTDYQPPGHNGETRDQRLAEFTTLNPSTPVLAIREGTALLLSGGRLSLQGSKGGYVFLGKQKLPIENGSDLSEYLG